MTYPFDKTIPTIVRVIESATPYSGSQNLDGSFSMAYTNVKYKLQGMNYKIAFTGSSGAGKTTLVKFLSERYNIPHISGSAGDVLKDVDDTMLRQAFGYYGNAGHSNVIANSITNPGFGIINQLLLQMRRQQIIETNDNFITDRSPVDNITYFINQCGAGPMMTNSLADQFFKSCVEAAQKLTHIIYIKAVQPEGTPVEDNGSRIPINAYQLAIDAQFEMWLHKIYDAMTIDKPRPQVWVIDWWDLERRKNFLINGIEGVKAGSGN